MSEHQRRIEAITSDEQLAQWVAGTSIHRRTTHHGSVSPFPKGSGIWKCNECDASGTLEELRVTQCPVGSGECCPDFSCCQPQLLWPEEKRKEFSAADDATREGMCMGALSAAFDLMEIRKTHIIGP